MERKQGGKGAETVKIAVEFKKSAQKGTGQNEKQQKKPQWGLSPLRFFIKKGQALFNNFPLFFRNMLSGEHIPDILPELLLLRKYIRSFRISNQVERHL